MTEKKSGCAPVVIGILVIAGIIGACIYNAEEGESGDGAAARATNPAVGTWSVLTVCGRERLEFQFHRNGTYTYRVVTVNTNRIITQFTGTYTYSDGRVVLEDGSAYLVDGNTMTLLTREGRPSRTVFRRR